MESLFLRAKIKEAFVLVPETSTWWWLSFRIYHHFFLLQYRTFKRNREIWWKIRFPREKNQKRIESYHSFLEDYFNWCFQGIFVVYTFLIPELTVFDPCRSTSWNRWKFSWMLSVGSEQTYYLSPWNRSTRAAARHRKGTRVRPTRWEL